MLRKFIAGSAVAGALALGAVGVAGAATPAPQSGASGAHAGAHAGANAVKAALCKALPQIESDIQTLHNTVNSTWVSDLKTLETKAQQAGHTKLADRIGTRLSHIEKRQSKANTRMQKLSSRCSSSG